MSRIQFASLTADPGQRVHGWVRVPGVEPPWELPSVVCRGRRSGPTLIVTAGIHAAEYPGIAAAARLARDTDPAQLRGTLIVIPLVNGPGFYERCIYTNPRDGKNINRTFPGDAHGTAAQQVTHFLTTELFAGADAYVDLHGGDLIEGLVPFAIYLRTGRREVDAQSQALANAYGLEYVLAASPDTVHGSSYTAAARLGVPAIIAEVGQQGICDPHSVNQHLGGLHRVLGILGMLDDQPTPVAQPTRLSGFVWMYADSAAAYYPTVAAGDIVKRDQVIGELRDIFGEVLQTLHAPTDGPVLFLISALAVKKGDPLLGIGVAE
jgi:predicted deacylase